MDSEILYKSVKLCEKEPTYLDYYIVPESISASYCDLKCYGIKIEKTVLFEGGGKIKEMQQIYNVFYRKSDADEFAELAAQNRVEPSGLRLFMEKYITESLDRARQKI